MSQSIGKSPKVQSTAGESCHSRFWLLIPWLGILQFLVCCLIAAQFYPGGDPLIHLVGVINDHYSFWRNPLSDLGRIVAWNGVDNTTSRSIYVPSLVLLAASLIPFACWLPTRLSGNYRLLCFAGFVFVLSICCLILVAITPYDILIVEHELALIGWLTTLVVSLVLIEIGCIHHWMKKREFAYKCLALVGILAIVLVAIHVFQTVTGNFRNFYIPMQKIVVMTCLGWICVALFSMRQSRTSDIAETRTRMLARLAGGACVVIVVGAWVWSCHEPLPVQVGPLDPAIMPVYSKESIGDLKSIEPKTVVGFVEGELSENETIMVTNWIIQDGTSKKVGSNSLRESTCKIIPATWKSDYVTRLAIVSTPRSALVDQGSAAKERNALQQNVLEVFYPALDFKTNFAFLPPTSFLMPGETRIIACSGDAWVMLKMGDTVESLANKVKGSLLITTVSRIIN